MRKLLETPKELAERVGIPVSNVRYLTLNICPINLTDAA